MASVLPSCIGNAFCFHNQAAYFLLAILIPFFSPFLVLCFLFLILFLAPLSFLLGALLLLCKVQVLIRQSHLEKDAATPWGESERKVSPFEVHEGRRDEGLPDDGESDDPNEQTMVALEAGEEKDVFHGSSSVGELTSASLHDDTEELHGKHEMGEGQDARHEMDKEEEDRYVMDRNTKNTEDVPSGLAIERANEEPSLLERLIENRQEGLSGSGGVKLDPERMEGFPSSSPLSCVAEEQESISRRMQPDLEEKSIEVIQENSGESRDNSKDHPKDKLHLNTLPSADSLGEHTFTDVSSIPDHGRPHTPLFEGSCLHRHPSIIPFEEQASEAFRETPDGDPDVHASTDIFFEVPGNELDAEFGVHGSMDDVDKVPGNLLSSAKVEICGDTSGERSAGQAFLPSSEEHLGSGELIQLKKQDVPTLTEEFEEGEPNGGLLTTQDDQQSHWLQDAEQHEERLSERHLDESFEADEHHLHEASSSILGSPTQRPMESIGSQEMIQEERSILEDIDAIKKIVGYKGDVDASMMEQITGLYLFLGMESYWGVDVADLESARTEVEVLKVVVGVK